MLTSLFKPKWQSKKPSVRLKAIDGLAGTSEELIQLATSDPDTGVQLSALKRLQCLETLSAIAQKSKGNELPTQAKKRIAELAVSPDIEEKALVSVYQLIDDTDVHTQIVLDTKKPLVVRKQAIQHVKDQTIFFQLASQDTSKEIQFLAAEKITQPHLIKQLQKQTRNNKKLRQLLKQRIEQRDALDKELAQLKSDCNELQQLGKGDQGKWEQDKTRQLVIKQNWQTTEAEIPTELAQQYQTNLVDFNKRLADYETEQQKIQPLRDQHRSIISQLTAITEKLNDVLSVDHQAVKNQQNELEAEWRTLSAQLPENELPSMQKAFNNAVAKFKKHYQSYQKSQQQLSRFQSLQQKAESLADSPNASLQEKEINALSKQWQKLKVPLGIDTADISKKFYAAINRLQAKFKQQNKQLTDKHSKLVQLVETMEAQVDSDKLGLAIKSYQTATQLLRTQPKLPVHQYRKIQQRINKMAPTIRSAQDWRHWGTDKAREELIDQAQNLISDTKTAPLDRSKTIKDLRNKWQKLGKMDPSKHQKLWERFDAACSKAYEPCQQFYQDESKQRKCNLAKRQAICDELIQLEKSTDWQSISDWKSITKQINQIRNNWKKSGSVDRNDWKNINQAFNDAMDTLEVHLANERRINWARRENLVQQAQALVTSYEDIAELISQAKTLQEHWQPTVTSRRSEEQKLWNSFRGALDAVFEQNRNAHNANRQAMKQNERKQQSVIDTMKAMASLNGSDLIQSASQISQLENEFHQYSDNRSKNKKLDTLFQQEKEQLTVKIAQAKNQQSIQQVQLLAQKGQLCSRKEQGETIEQEWHSLAILDDRKLEARIAHRYEAKDISSEQQDKNLNQLLKTTLEIEIHLALKTPNAYQKDRIQWQVDQLADQMLSASDTQPSKDDIALSKIKDWYCTGKVEESQRKLLEQRFAQVEQWLNDFSESA